jgi:crossover junction endodeoxyribonuclease RuvC
VKEAARIVLGIDPGSQFTGFGVVRAYPGNGGRIEHVSHGVIALPKVADFHTRIGVLAIELDALLARVKPDMTVVERIFLGKNADSAFKLGHARGVAVASAVRFESVVVEYAARSVKKGITGSGASSKEQVQMILFKLLGIRKPSQLDASDALALAFYHARNLEISRHVRGASEALL